MLLVFVLVNRVGGLSLAPLLREVLLPFKLPDLLGLMHRGNFPVAVVMAIFDFISCFQITQFGIGPA